MLTGIHRTTATLAGVWMSFVLQGLAPIPGAAAEGTACQSEPTDMVIGYGDLINCAIDRIGDGDVFRFRGGSGETVYIQAARRSGVGIQCFQLYDPDGTRLRGTACGNRGVDYLLQKTGTYTIDVTESGTNETVAYALALERIDPPSRASLPIQYNQVLDDEIDGLGDVDVFHLAGEAGSTIKVGASRVGGVGIQCFQLFGPDGARLRGTACGNRTVDYLLDESGTHAIAVIESGVNETVKYALNLTCVSGRCPALALPDVAGCIAVRGAPLRSNDVVLKQPGRSDRTTKTDIRGCYEFDPLVVGREFDILITGPEFPR